MSRIELGLTITPDKTLPEEWDYRKSVLKMGRLMFTWKQVSIDMLRELWVARETLSQPGLRSDLVPNGTRSWSGYLEEVGLPRMTAHRWLEQYDPVEQKKIDPPSLKPPSRKIDSDAEFERKKQEWEEEKRAEEDEMPFSEAVGHIGRILDQHKKDEIFREHTIDGVVDELRRRVIEVADIDRRHEVASAVIKAMREVAAECDRLSAQASEVVTA